MRIDESNNHREWMIWVIISIPFIYLASIWSGLPEIIPIHFNIRGEPDSWGSKNVLIWTTSLLMGIIYIIFRIIPHIDPKMNIQKMGNKYFQFKLIMITFMATLSMFVSYSAKAGSIKNPFLLFSLIGVLFMILGNYLPSFKPNYFMGIRTPWTLESDKVWSKTHRFGGQVWVVGGLVLAVIPFLLKEEPLFYAFMAIVLVLVVVPVVYSYRIYHRKNGGYV